MVSVVPGSKSKMKDFGGETPYSVMFGPDICGFGTRKTHVIFNYKEKNHLVKKDIKCETDQLSHVYTLRLMPNNTYEVRAGGCSWLLAGQAGHVGLKGGSCKQALLLKELLLETRHAAAPHQRASGP